MTAFGNAAYPIDWHAKLRVGAHESLTAQPFIGIGHVDDRVVYLRRVFAASLVAIGTIKWFQEHA